MAYTKIYRKKKAPVKRRRMTMRKSMVRQMPRLPTMSFTRTFWKENWAFSSVTTAGFWRQYTPSFGDLPNAAEYTALFDVYRINAVKITFRPRYDGFDANGTNPAGGVTDLPYLNTYVDPRTNTNTSGAYTAATFNTFVENANGRVKSRKAVAPYSVYWKPLVSVNSYTAGNPGEFKRCPWLSTANYPTVPMRLLNVFISNNNFSANIGVVSFDVFYTFYFQCRGAK